MLRTDASTAERLEYGKNLRTGVPRSSHAQWEASADRIPAKRLIDAHSKGRLGGLVPLRNARIAETPFTFFRGSAVVMAADLARTPATGIIVQACGDAHCLNFGGFATPERNLIFDLNDFDETLPGPWEWDLKRLSTSIVLAGRERGFKKRDIAIATLAALQAYRTRIRDLASEPVLNVWYSRLDARHILDEARSENERRRRGTIAGEAATASIANAVAKFTEVVDGQRRFKDDPPTLFHSPITERTGFDMEEIFATYRDSLRDDVKTLFDRYTMIDNAIKVVGVGSVGTRCAIALFHSHDDDAIILQVKQALPSVLAPYVSPVKFSNQGERVIHGQRLLQSASDVLLGWASSGGHDFYVRQFKDMKASADLDAADKNDLREYARYCAWALAAGHSRSADAAAIAGYIGRSDVFDRAMLDFSVAYADQAERDHGEFVAAIEQSELKVERVPA